jgi:hypothetical protein
VFVVENGRISMTKSKILQYKTHQRQLDSFLSVPIFSHFLPRSLKKDEPHEHGTKETNRKTNGCGPVWVMLIMGKMKGNITSKKVF